MDMLILNTAVSDLRHEAFGFTRDLAGPGGLARGKTADMPDFSQEQIHQWIAAGHATAGGPGNTAPLAARTGAAVAVGVNLGTGDYDGLDAQGRYWYDVMVDNGVDMSSTVIHPTLPTGTTFIHDTDQGDRGGIVYFPNANNDFDFEQFKPAVQRMKPRIVFYMYSGLSDRGDAHGGKDLGDFMRWCRDRGCVTIVDSHTLTGNPAELIAAGTPVEAYKLLEPLLGELDIFFTSCDEARMIENTFGAHRNWEAADDTENIAAFLRFLAQRFWTGTPRARLFGVTVRDGAYVMAMTPDGSMTDPVKITSRFMAGSAVDLVGAGDSFRAGLVTYISQFIEAFKDGTLDVSEAVQTANLFAALYVKAPLDDRLRQFPSV